MRFSSLRKVLRNAAVLAAAVMLAAGLAPTGAQASGNGRAEVLAQNPERTYSAGVAETRAQGENIRVLDWHADGWGIRAQLQTLEWDSSGYRYWKDHGGVCFDDTNRSNHTGGASFCYENVAEGKTYRVHIWASRGSATTYHNYSPGITA